MTSDRSPDPGSAAAAAPTPHWQEYPPGRVAEVAVGVARMLVPFLVGLGGTFLLVLALGLLAEEQGRLLGPVLGDALDQLARYTLAPLMALAWLAGLTTCLARAVRDVTVSRAVQRAAARDASTTAVPHPAQVELIVSRPGGALGVWAWIHLALFGLLGVVGVFVAVSDSSGLNWLIVAASLGLAALFGAGTQLLRRRLLPEHEQRRREIAAHWGVQQEVAAWQRARHPGEDAAGALAAPSTPATLLNRLSPILLVLAMLVLNGLLLLTHPEAQRIPGGEAGPRADLSAGGERLATAGVWTFVVLVVAGLGCAVLGALTDARVHTAERATLHRALADPGADRPAGGLIQRYAEHHTPPLVEAAAAVGAATLCVGLAGTGLGTLAVEEIGSVYAGAGAVYAALVPTFLAVAAVGAVLVLVALAGSTLTGARGRDLRNQLNARWPVRPEVTQDKDSTPHPARVGPALAVPIDLPGRDRG